MHFRTIARREIADRLRGARSDVVVSEGVAKGFKEESFYTAGGARLAQLRVHTPALRPSSPDGLVLMGKCVGSGAPIPAELSIEIQVFVLTVHEDAEGYLDDVETTIWPLLMTRPMTDPALSRLRLSFDDELTQHPDPNAELAQMIRVLRFTIAGEFDPANPSALRPQA